jgi:hypothetical protein
MSMPTGEYKVTTNTTTKATWIRRVSFGAVLAAAPALIALGTAASSHADATGPNFNAPHQTTTTQYPGADGSWHQRHQADIQSWYQ